MILNIESNFISGPTIRDILSAINVNQSIREFRAANQRPAILGNRIEMEIAKLVEQNKTLLRLGLNLDVPDARMRVAQRLQQNKDDCKRHITYYLFFPNVFICFLIQFFYLDHVFLVLVAVRFIFSFSELSELVKF